MNFASNLAFYFGWLEAWAQGSAGIFGGCGFEAPAFIDFGEISALAAVLTSIFAVLALDFEVTLASVALLAALAFAPWTHLS